MTPTPTEPAPVIPSEAVTLEVSLNTQDTPEITNTIPETSENDGYMQREVNGKMVEYTIEKTYEGCTIIDALNNANYEYTENFFPDSKDSKYPRLIDVFGNLKITNGNTNNLFKPKREITRAEFTKMVLISHCYEYQNEDTKERPYTDLEDATWEARVVSKAQKL